ncbi:Protein SEY1 [Galdieria sulphuraria]|nr:Protein SEY1 [Galdieria sulphuraria]
MECELIDREGTFSGHLPLSNKTLPCRNYVTLAIIGCQSSGKSTLFNELFETKFPVLDAKKNGRQRTTLGIWSTTKNVDQLQNKESSSERGCSRQLVLLDVEGTDSRERQEPTKTFDLCTTLFCLTVADVILVNLWFRDVGRHQASNADLYASVFSTTLKWKEIEGLDVMRKKHLKTRLLIVIRDFEEVEASEDQVKWFISQDFRNIWKTVEKPKSLEDTVMEDIFILSFHFLPNVKYRKDEFVSSVSKLRERILHDDDSWSSSITDSLWKKEIPLQILEMFLKESWDLIKQRQGLNNDLNNISYFDLNTHKKCSFYLEQSWNEYKLMLIEFQRTVERNYSVKLTSELLEVRKFQIWAYRDQILHSFEIEFAPMIGAVGNFKKNAGNLVKRKVKDFQKCLEKISNAHSVTKYRIVVEKESLCFQWVSLLEIQVILEDPHLGGRNYLSRLLFCISNIFSQKQTKGRNERRCKIKREYFQKVQLFELKVISSQERFFGCTLLDNLLVTII